MWIQIITGRWRTRATRYITATCCKQRWTLSVINLRQNWSHNACDNLRLRVIASCLSKVANFNLPHLHLSPPSGVTPLEFCREFRHQKTIVCGLLYGVVCVILRLAVSVEHRLVTDRQTDTRLRHNNALTWRCAVTSNKSKYWRSTYAIFRILIFRWFFSGIFLLPYFPDYRYR